MDISAIRAEVDAAVNEAVHLADLVTKYADFAARFGGAIPGAGAEVQAAVKAIDEADKALHVLQNALNAV